MLSQSSTRIAVFQAKRGKIISQFHQTLPKRSIPQLREKLLKTIILFKPFIGI